MTAVGTFLLVAGLIFPALSWFSIVAALLASWRKKRSSPVFIPVVGPILLTSWILVEGRSAWLIPIVWLGDIGTMVFFVVLPRLTREWWRTSRFTCIMTLHGVSGIEQATITFHRGGDYVLRKSWNRPRNQAGFVGLGEPGRFVACKDTIELESDFGLKRTLRRVGEDSFVVEESLEGHPEWERHSLRGWVLKS